LRSFAFDQFDTPGAVQELPQPEPEAGQVRVRVAAAAINPADIGVIKGFYKDRMEHHFPLIPGIDLAGTVDAVGPGVEQWKVGDEVFGGQGKMFWGEGTLAEFATASASTIVRRPEEVDPEFAAALNLAGVSALTSVDAVAPQQGDVVVVIGAAGGVGGFSVQLATAAGGRVVGVSRGSNADYVRNLGAAQVVDYTAQDVYDTVRAAYPDGIAGIVHTAGDKQDLARLSELVREGGNVVSMIGAADVENLATRGVVGTNVVTMTTGDALERLGDLAAAGTLKRPQIKLFPLEQAGDAYAEIGTGHVRGKLVVIPAGS
jgi:NADPH2:quinone reductase